MKRAVRIDDANDHGGKMLPDASYGSLPEELWVSENALEDGV